MSLRPHALVFKEAEDDEVVLKEEEEQESYEPQQTASATLLA
jgi:hypothetical protein